MFQHRAPVHDVVEVGVELEAEPARSPLLAETEVKLVDAIVEELRKGLEEVDRDGPSRGERAAKGWGDLRARIRRLRSVIECRKVLVDGGSLEAAPDRNGAIQPEVRPTRILVVAVIQLLWRVDHEAPLDSVRNKSTKARAIADGIPDAHAARHIRPAWESRIHRDVEASERLRHLPELRRQAIHKVGLTELRRLDVVQAAHLRAADAAQPRIDRRRHAVRIVVGRRNQDVVPGRLIAVPRVIVLGVQGDPQPEIALDATDDIQV